MKVGTGSYTYELQKDWAKLPSGYKWGWVPAVACDSRDRVYVYSRSEQPLMVFDLDGNYLETWGEGVVTPLAAHGLFIDRDDNVFCTDHTSHCLHKFDRDGSLVMTLGEPGQAAATVGDPFDKPTDAAVASTGELFVSDGYGNYRVHKYSPDGKLLHSWGEEGTGPGQFALPHCVRVDKADRVWVCDRENNRIQIFDMDGNYLTEWTDLRQPNTVHFDPEDDVVYVAELDHRFSIFTSDGELITRWGGEEDGGSSMYEGGPHGIWVDSRGDLYMGEVLLGDEGRLHKFARV